MLEHEAEWLRSILRQARDIIIATDQDGNVTDLNEEAERVLGYTAEEVLGQPADSFFVSPSKRRKLLEALKKSGKGVVRADVRVKTKDGRRPWLGISFSWLKDPQGNVVGTLSVSKDVTKRRRLEEKLLRLSITDKLTGLYNQAHFFHRLEIEKERALRLNHGLALVLFDLDGFKALNDTEGHVRGDELLKHVGQVLIGNIRKEVDSAFRYGGDEFCVLLPGADTRMAVTFSHRVRARIAGLDGGVRASIGVCAFDPKNRALQMVEKADAAMYTVKEAGGNGVAVFDLEQGISVHTQPPG